jgi:hypothetical protein
MRRQCKISDKTRSVPFGDEFYWKNGEIKLRTGTTTTIDNSTHTIEVVGTGVSIQILESTPAPIANQLVLWVDKEHFDSGTMIDHGIQCVFPDGMNHNLVIPFGFANPDAGEDQEFVVEG